MNLSQRKPSSESTTPNRMASVRLDRELVLGAILALLMLGATAWSWSQYRSAQRAQTHAKQDLAACEAAASRIQAMRDLPDIAATLDQQDRQVPALVDQAAKTAGFSARDTVDAIDANRPRRVGDSLFKQASTHVNLRRVTLPQLVTFLGRIQELDPALGVSRLRVTAPRGEETGSTWAAETTLTYLIYAPPSASEGK